MKKIMKLMVQLTLSAVMLYLAFRNVQFDEARRALKNVNYEYLIVGVLFQFSSFFIRAYRWQLLITPIKQVSFISSFRVLAASYAANNILPFRMGDVIRAILIGNRENVSKVSSFSTVLVERIGDGLTMLLFMFVGFLGLQSDEAWTKQASLLSVLFFFGVVIFIGLLNRFQDSFIILVVRLTGKFSVSLAKKIEQFLKNFLLAFRVIGSSKVLLLIIISSLIVWILEASLFTFVALALNLPITTSIWLGFITVAIVNLGIMVPSSPGYVGTFEFFCMLSLGLFSIDQHLSASYSILVHMGQYIPITILGGLMWMNLSLNKQNKEFIQKDGLL